MRGGQTTFHGPGQLVGYPIIKLSDFELGVRTYISALEHILIDYLSHTWNIQSRTTEDTGVWVGDRKIAALGIQVRRHVTSHGFALNCSTDLAWFDHIVPCGLVGKGVTSLSVEAEREVSVAEVVPGLCRAMGETLDARMEPLSQVDVRLDRELDAFVDTVGII
ncbi:putative lipoyltransferase 2, mitochondrial [Thoreauomyces humboldtii]|nr:putative lipoyltransferase 2, mitochondrial [Thoreauomyces humboldtii]